MKNKKINREDVYRFIVDSSMDFMNPEYEVVNIVLIINKLQTSKYQVKKYIDQMITDGILKSGKITEKSKYKWDILNHGYQLTEAGMNTDYYRKKQAELNESILYICN